MIPVARGYPRISKTDYATQSPETPPQWPNISAPLTPASDFPFHPTIQGGPNQPTHLLPRRHK